MLNKTRMSVLKKANAYMVIASMVVYLIAPVAVLIPQAVFAADLFSEEFGSANSSTVAGWTENNPAEIAGSSSGEDVTRDGFESNKFVKIGDDGWICRPISTSGYNFVTLKYFWKGDNDAEDNKDYGYVEYSSTGTCSSGASWTNVATHELDDGANGGASWSGEQSVGLPDGVTLIRFRQTSTTPIEHFRVDGVRITGNSIPATIYATKIVCDSESDLPDWGGGGGDNNIISSTASSFLSSHPNCHAEEGWNFQWGTESATNLGDNGTSPLGSPWTTFGPTNGSGVSTANVTINSSTDGQIWMREVLQSGYLAFTGASGGNVSAEMYCSVDNFKYDNFDRIDNPVAGGTYYCVAFNVLKTGSITVSKNIVAPDGETDVSDNHEFDVTLDGSNSQKISEGNSYKYDDLAPGTYTVAESIGDPDFDLLRISNDNDDNAQNGALVTVTAGEDTAVTITNAQKSGHLTVKKVVVNHGIGDAVSADFTMSVDGTNVSETSFGGREEGTTVTMDPGNYSVNESGPDGYAMSQSEDCSGTMASNGEVTCTVTNSDIPEGEGAITVIKHVDNLHGGELGADVFDIYISDESVISGEANFLEPDDYIITEGDPTSLGYTQKNISCTNGESTTSDGFVTLGIQDAWVCTITNEDLPATLTIVKNTNGGDGDFHFDVTEVGDVEVVTEEGVGSTEVILDAGTYDVVENVPEGWTLAGSSCEYDGDEAGTEIQDGEHIYLDNGDHVTCTFENTRNEDPIDETPPESTFDNTEGHDHQIIDTEIVQLSLVSQSTDVTPASSDVESGVASAKMELYKLADAGTMDADSFFDITYGEMSCSNLGETVPIELVSLNLTSAEPFSVSWAPQMPDLERGVYCAVVNATDNAGNIEHTAVAGPFAYTFTPTSTYVPQCSDSADNDGDGLIDRADPACTSDLLDSEVNSTGGGGGGANGPIITGGGGGGGGANGPIIPSQGQVLGESAINTELCSDILLNDYMRMGRSNNSAEVKKLQEFLNNYNLAGLPTTGFFGPLTHAAVKAFQVREAENILTPWTKATGSIDNGGTGYVYKTTKRWVNILHCNALDIPMPQLP